jgi:hypothetical protein
MNVHAAIISTPLSGEDAKCGDSRPFDRLRARSQLPNPAPPGSL